MSRSRSRTRSGAWSRPSWTACGRSRAAHGRDRRIGARGRRLQRGRHGSNRGRSVCAEVVPLSVNRTLGLVTVAPRCVLAERRRAEGSLDAVVPIAAPADVRIRVEREGRWVASPLRGASSPGCRASCGTARASAGRCATASTGGRRGDGRVGDVSYGVPFVSDTVAPRVRILPGKGLKVEVSEPSMLTFVIDGQALRARSKEGRRAHPVERSRDASSRRGLGRCRQRQRAGGPCPAPRLAAGPASRLDACRRLTSPSGRTSIESILPHRDPFLLVDEVTELEPGRRVVARRR